MGITLANFQLKAIEALMEAMGEPNRDIILKSCTGSGKTIILTHFMDEYLKSTNKAVFVWLTPGKGNLELQSKAKMDKYIHGSNTKLLSDIMSSGFEENDACFINWEKLTKKGNNALKDSERTNFVEHIQNAIPLRDYYQSRKRIWVKYLIPVVLGLLALAGALIFNIGNEETIRSTFSEFVNVQINVVAILVSFSVAIISILVTADNANTKSLKEEMADSTQYKPVGGKQLSLFQILLSNIAYNVIVEIIYLVILIGIALIRPIIPLQALKYVAAVCIFAIMHILGVLLESVAQMYLTFWRNR